MEARNHAADRMQIRVESVSPKRARSDSAQSTDNQSKMADFFPKLSVQQMQDQQNQNQQRQNRNEQPKQLQHRGMSKMTDFFSPLNQQPEMYAIFLESRYQATHFYHSVLVVAIDQDQKTQRHQ
jgi:hypothetical protein